MLARRFRPSSFRDVRSERKTDGEVELHVLVEVVQIRRPRELKVHEEVADVHVDAKAEIGLGVIELEMVGPGLEDFGPAIDPGIANVEEQVRTDVAEPPPSRPAEDQVVEQLSLIHISEPTRL